MSAAGILLALALSGGQHFLTRDFVPLSAVERWALRRCTGDWLHHVSPESATGLCACYVRGLRRQAGAGGVPAAKLAGWPRRTAEASLAFAACFEPFVARDQAACVAESVREGWGEAGCCGSGGCLGDFARRQAYRSGYLRLEDQLGDGKDMPRNPWTEWSQRHFLTRCGQRGFPPKRCGCYLQVARIELTEQDYLARGDDVIYDPPNAFDELVEWCDLFHESEPGKRVTPGPANARTKRAGRAPAARHAV